jgi:Prophage maintenance system killer protein
MKKNYQELLSFISQERREKVTRIKSIIDKKLSLYSEVMIRIEVYGGSDGLRDENLLDSALAAPFHTFDGKSVLLSIQQKAVRLGFGLIMNHPFVDGNKRIGVHIMLTIYTFDFLELGQ